MLTIEALNELGANTKEGMERCLNNEEFYLRLVKMAVMDDGFEKLKDAVEAKDLDEAFERAHALKGVIGNVSLTNIFIPIQEITEELRARLDINYTEILGRIFTELEKVRSLVDD
ncbi:MAG: Hpt domain-containing protein [Eubacterium sp.]|nr:Hpt domain-containing protein [Eubacterium sp.]